jgi:hypothetical protein
MTKQELETKRKDLQSVLEYFEQVKLEEIDESSWISLVTTIKGCVVMDAQFGLLLSLYRSYILAVKVQGIVLTIMDSRIFTIAIHDRLVELGLPTTFYIRDHESGDVERAVTPYAEWMELVVRKISENQK